VKFAQVVTQTRNIDDTGLETVGTTARQQMKFLSVLLAGGDAISEGGEWKDDGEGAMTVGDQVVGFVSLWLED